MIRIRISRIIAQWRIQGRGPGGPAPPLLFFDENEARRAEKKLLETATPPPPPYFMVWMTAPPHPYLKVWIRLRSASKEPTNPRWERIHLFI